MPTNKNNLIWQATVKAYPAIADLQAIREVILRQDFHIVVAAGNYLQPLYAVPANYVCVAVAFSGSCSTANPTFIKPGIRRVGIDHYLGVAPYGGVWDVAAVQVTCPGEFGDVYEILWNGVQIGDQLYGWFVGYLVAKY